MRGFFVAWMILWLWVIDGNWVPRSSGAMLDDVGPLSDPKVQVESSVWVTVGFQQFGQSIVFY